VKFVSISTYKDNVKTEEKTIDDPRNMFLQAEKEKVRVKSGRTFFHLFVSKEVIKLF